MTLNALDQLEYVAYYDLGSKCDSTIKVIKDSIADGCKESIMSQLARPKEDGVVKSFETLMDFQAYSKNELINDEDVVQIANPDNPKKTLLRLYKKESIYLPFSIREVQNKEEAEVLKNDPLWVRENFTSVSLGKTALKALLNTQKKKMDEVDMAIKDLGIKYEITDEDDGDVRRSKEQLDEATIALVKKQLLDSGEASETVFNLFKEEKKAIIEKPIKERFSLLNMLVDFKKIIENKLAQKVSCVMFTLQEDPQNAGVVLSQDQIIKDFLKQEPYFSRQEKWHVTYTKDELLQLVEPLSPEIRELVLDKILKYGTPALPLDFFHGVSKVKTPILRSRSFEDPTSKEFLEELWVPSLERYRMFKEQKLKNVEKDEDLEYPEFDSVGAMKIASGSDIESFDFKAQDSQKKQTFTFKIS